MSAISDRALARAEYQSKHGPRYGYGQCMWRTRMLYDAPAIGDYDGDGSPDAEDGWKFAKHRHPTTSTGSIPRGVPVWWGGGSHDNGHVAPSAGSGLCWSTDIERSGYYDLVPIALIHQKWGLPLLGWSEDIDGVRVYTPPGDAPEKAGDDMANYADWPKKQKDALAGDVASAVVDRLMHTNVTGLRRYGKKSRQVRVLLAMMLNQLGDTEATAEEIETAVKGETK